MRRASLRLRHRKRSPSAPGAIEPNFWIWLIQARDRSPSDAHISRGIAGNLYANYHRKKASLAFPTDSHAHLISGPDFVDNYLSRRARQIEVRFDGRWRARRRRNTQDSQHPLSV